MTFKFLKKKPHFHPLLRSAIYGLGTGALLVYFVADFPVGVIPIVYERY